VAKFFFPFVCIRVYSWPSSLLCPMPQILMDHDLCRYLWMYIRGSELSARSLSAVRMSLCVATLDGVAAGSIALAWKRFQNLNLSRTRPGSSGYPFDRLRAGLRTGVWDTERALGRRNMPVKTGRGSHIKIGLPSARRVTVNWPMCMNGCEARRIAMLATVGANACMRSGVGLAS
jgi:hypothetical protein